MADGINKVVSYKVESAWGTKPAATSPNAQTLRRVTSSFQLEKDTYQSDEINTSQQVKDFRHGTRRGNGTLSGEISGSAYGDFIQAALRRDFTTGATTTAVITISANESAGVSTFPRSSGSYITDGFKVGDPVTVTGFTDPANNGLFIVTNVVALTLTVEHFDEDGALVNEAAGDSVTIAVSGKKTYVPATGHTDKSFSIEEWFSDDSISRIFTGQIVDTMSINVAPNSMATIEFGFMGKNAEPATGTQYFTSPVAQTNEGTYSGVDGLLLVNGVVSRKVTSLAVNLASNTDMVPVIGSTSIGDYAKGKVNVTGSLSAIFTDTTFLNYFDAETEVSITYALRSASGTDAFAVTLPRVKLGSGSVTDGEVVLVLDGDYTALERIDGSTINDATTMAIVDTTL